MANIHNSERRSMSLSEKERLAVSLVLKHWVRLNEIIKANG